MRQVREVPLPHPFDVPRDAAPQCYSRVIRVPLPLSGT